MRQRSLSATGVVILGLLPTLIGGPVFAVAMTIIALVAGQELLALLRMRGQANIVAGAVVLIGSAIVAYFSPESAAALLIAGAVFLPLSVSLARPTQERLVQEWSATAAATLYVGSFLVGAIVLREQTSGDPAGWLESVADTLALGSEPAAYGLGLFLLALLITWLSDTAAYLVGRQFGQRPLLPSVSPKKTVEGALGGLAAAGLTALLCTIAFSLPLHPLVAFLIGVVLGAIGIIGDLCESLLKRRAGVKDSGTLIPGHGGVLDRIDALIFVTVATWILLPFLF